MTFISPVGGSMPPPSEMLSRQVLDMEVQVRRARLAELEAEMIAAARRRHGVRASKRVRVSSASIGTGQPGIAISPPPCGWKRNSARTCAAFARKSANSNG
jgi:hypothetical protein